MCYSYDVQMLPYRFLAMAPWLGEKNELVQLQFTSICDVWKADFTRIQRKLTRFWTASDSDFFSVAEQTMNKDEAWSVELHQCH